MVYRDYTIDILINGSLVEMGPSEFSFSVSDNIYSMYPEIDFEIQDPVGLFHEYLTFLPGEEIEITYGRGDSLIKNSYISNFFQTEEQMSSGYLNGKLRMNGIHSFAKNQTIESFAYEGSPSEIVQELISAENFKELRIDNSENQRIWYRPLINKRDFIKDILLENVYSNDSNDTPFFAFVDSGNVFHFESFFTLMERSPEEDLELNPGEYEIRGGNRLFTFQPLSEKYSTLRKRLSQKFYERLEDSFQFEEIEEHITEVYPGNYLLSQESPVFTDYRYFSKEKNEKYKNDIRGQELFSFRSSLLTNKVFVTLPLNANLVSGKTVSLSVASAFGENESSLSYTGKYLIEQSRHIWKGETQNGYTELVIARKNKNLPDDYLINERLFST